MPFRNHLTKKDKKITDNDQHGEWLMETGRGSVGAQGRKAGENLEESSEFHRWTGSR